MDMETDAADDDGGDSPSKRSRQGEVLTATVQLAAPLCEGSAVYTGVGLVEFDAGPSHNDVDVSFPEEEAWEDTEFIPAHLLAAARREEVEYMRDIGVFEVVPRAAARERRTDGSIETRAPHRILP